jgi:hypothetical protein
MILLFVRNLPTCEAKHLVQQKSAGQSLAHQSYPAINSVLANFFARISVDRAA